MLYNDVLILINYMRGDLVFFNYFVILVMVYFRDFFLSFRE